MFIVLYSVYVIVSVLVMRHTNNDARASLIETLDKEDSKGSVTRPAPSTDGAAGPAKNKESTIEIDDSGEY